MKYKSKCQCGNDKFIVITEKLYEGNINEDRVLLCEPEEQHVEHIKCSKCDKTYSVADFNGVEY